MEKKNFIPKFKIGQRIRYIGKTKIVEFLHKKNNIFTIDEIINYNNVEGYFPQCVPLKYSFRNNSNECHYLIGGRWNVSESELISI